MIVMNELEFFFLMSNIPTVLPRQSYLFIYIEFHENGKYFNQIVGIFIKQNSFLLINLSLNSIFYQVGMYQMYNARLQNSCSHYFGFESIVYIQFRLAILHQNNETIYNCV